MGAKKSHTPKPHPTRNSSSMKNKPGMDDGASDMTRSAHFGQTIHGKFEFFAKLNVGNIFLSRC